MVSQGAESYRGKVVFVTGASSGIGRASALAFAREGANVVVADVLKDEAAQSVRLIEELGQRALFVKCDVSRDDEVRNAVGKTLEIFGRLDCAFNNAGIEGKQATTVDCTEENWDRTLGINLKGIWLCMKYQIPSMLKQGSGAIVNCSSVAGLVGFPGLPAYVASKHGVMGLTKSAALEFSRSNIRINAVCPGVIQTPMIDRLSQGNPDFQKQVMASEPIGRFGKPEEVASAVVWLCSDAASYVTGTALSVDGGWSAL